MRGNPVKVAKNGIKEAEKVHSVVIVDTAGRLGVDAELMQQAADIRKAINPNEVLFVIDAMIGQDAVDDRPGIPTRRRQSRAWC